MSKEAHASPSDDILARQAWRGPTLANGTLTPELVAFCQKGISVIVGSCAGDGLPVAGRGFACRIDEVGTVRILMRRAGHEALFAALRGGAPIAATFTEPPQHRSIQLKGRQARETPCTVADGMALAVQSRAFRDRMMAMSYTEEMSNGYCFAEADDLVAVEFLPDEAFVQTPGPSAGTALTS